MPSSSRLVVLVALTLAACGPSAEAPAELAPPESPETASADAPTPADADSTEGGESVLGIDGEGLRVFDPETGSSRALPFGTPSEQTIAALTALRGEPDDEGMNDECRASFARWNGLTAWFSDERFAGWATQEGDGALTTAAGLGIGSSRSDLDDAYAAEVAPSTLGVEFSAGDLNGLLDSEAPDARITNLWAGTTCLFR